MITIINLLTILIGFILLTIIAYIHNNISNIITWFKQLLCKHKFESETAIYNNCLKCDLSK